MHMPWPALCRSGSPCRVVARFLSSPDTTCPVAQQPPPHANCKRWRRWQHIHERHALLLFIVSTAARAHDLPRGCKAGSSTRGHKARQRPLTHGSVGQPQARTRALAFIGKAAPASAAVATTAAHCVSQAGLRPLPLSNQMRSTRLRIASRYNNGCSTCESCSTKCNFAHTQRCRSSCVPRTQPSTQYLAMGMGETSYHIRKHMRDSFCRK